LAFLSHEGNGLAFFQAFETVAFDSFEVYEQVVTATLRSDEAEPFSSLNHLTVPVWRLDMVYLQETYIFSVLCCSGQLGTPGYHSRNVRFGSPPDELFANQSCFLYRRIGLKAPV